MFRVAILIHQYDSFHKSSYWLRRISEIWRENGVRVSVINDPSTHVEADVAILHVNRTFTPKQYLDFVRRSPLSINGDVSDISKRSISSNLIHRNDDYAGPVIVKTNLNYKGWPELQLAKSGPPSLGRGYSVKPFLDYLEAKYKLARHRWRHGSDDAYRDYPIFHSIGEVPDAVWRDRELIVERFLPERRDGYYCVRTWLFLGDRERHALFYSHEPVIKSQNILGHERLAEVPAELRQMRKNMRFDYGKFDYAMVDGQIVLYDANRTPMIGNFPRERYMPLAQELAEGLGSFSDNPGKSETKAGLPA